MYKIGVQPDIKRVKGLLGEFREFITKGNVMDLAVGIIIGAAFTSIVNSLVNDIIMPPIGLLTGKVDLSGLFISLNGQYYANLATAVEAHAPVLKYGTFINAVINFLIVALVVFVIVKQVNNLKRKQAVKDQKEVPETRHCPYCFQEVHNKATKCAYCTSELK